MIHFNLWIYPPDLNLSPIKLGIELSFALAKYHLFFFITAHWFFLLNLFSGQALSPFGVISNFWISEICRFSKLILKMLAFSPSSKSSSLFFFTPLLFNCLAKLLIALVLNPMYASILKYLALPYFLLLIWEHLHKYWFFYSFNSRFEDSRVFVLDSIVHLYCSEHQILKVTASVINLNIFNRIYLFTTLTKL